MSMMNMMNMMNMTTGRPPLLHKPGHNRRVKSSHVNIRVARACACACLPVKRRPGKTAACRRAGYPQHRTTSLLRPRSSRTMLSAAGWRWSVCLAGTTKMRGQVSG